MPEIDGDSLFGKFIPNPVFRVGSPFFIHQDFFIGQVLQCDGILPAEGMVLGQQNLQRAAFQIQIFHIFRQRVLTDQESGLNSSLLNLLDDFMIADILDRQVHVGFLFAKSRSTIGYILAQEIGGIPKESSWRW